MNTITKFITPASFDDIDFERRFGGIARLYGAAALSRFRAARVCVVGVGGVGSWIVEALARSAIGHLTLIDLDNVAESNINRQIQALSATLGQAKVTALAQHIDQQLRHAPYQRSLLFGRILFARNFDIYIRHAFLRGVKGRVGVNQSENIESRNRGARADFRRIMTLQAGPGVRSGVILPAMRR
jgi:hypothetical protein